MPEEIQEKSNDAKKYIYILVIFIGLIVLGSTYVAYTYFNKAPKVIEQEKIAGAEVTENTSENNDESVFQKNTLGITQANPNDSFGIVDSGEVIQNTVKTLIPAPVKEVEKIQMEPTKQSDTSGISNAKTWKANDYKFGDIKIGKYIVVNGDTLWELAEGAYGNGSKWTNIAKVNIIKYFPNGRPLINVGQVLEIPAL